MQPSWNLAARLTNLRSGQNGVGSRVPRGQCHRHAPRVVSSEARFHNRLCSRRLRSGYVVCQRSNVLTQDRAAATVESVHFRDQKPCSAGIGDEQLPSRQIPKGILVAERGGHEAAVGLNVPSSR